MTIMVVLEGEMRGKKAEKYLKKSWQKTSKMMKNINVYIKKFS
jgi:hypothetical protein